MKRDTILILCRARELNGITFLSKAMSDLAPGEFVWCRSVGDFVWEALARKAQIQTVLGMSDIEALIAVCIARLLRIRVPILLGVFHPKQWIVSLDSNYAPHKARVFSKLLDELPASNLVSTSWATIDACAKIRTKYSTGCQLIAGPVTLPGEETPCKRPTADSIVTVGRYVDFKVCTIVAMIGVVEQLNESGWSVDYHIYGEGPSAAVIARRIAESRCRERLHLHGAMALEDYRREMLKHTLFFGMGGALFQAGLAGIPALIAIQGEAVPLTYGLLPEHDHKRDPVFGDPMPNLPARDLSSAVKTILALKPADWVRLAEDCRSTAKPFSGRAVLDRVRRAAANAVHMPRARVSILDLFRIRFETYYARFAGKPGIHV